MNHRRTHRYLLIAAGLMLGARLFADAGALRSETWDRKVDMAALGAQNKAIAKYAALVKRYRNTDQERVLRMRLLEAMESATNLEFRIANGEARLHRRSIDYGRYNASLKRVIDTASILIKQAPEDEDSTRVYFVRAQAFHELKEIPKAKKDYEFITAHFSKSTWAVRSNIALGAYATEEGNHRRAIEYLKRVEEFPDDPHYPFALYQLAWSHFNLGDVPTGLAYLKRHIAYYREKQDNLPDKQLPPSEKAYLEHSLKDVVMFYFDGFTKSLSGFTLADALPTFRKIEEGPFLGKMVVEFANLLRSRDRLEELDKWQAQITDEESERPEALEVVVIHIDGLFVHKAFDQMVSAAAGLKKLDEKTKGKMRQSESYAKAQNLLLQVASSIQKTIAQTKSHDKSLALSRILVGVYEAFTAIVEESDPRLAQIHYNLAETLFSIDEFDSATTEYQWVLAHWQNKAALKRSDVSLKAIASRYQSLDRHEALPKDLKPAKLSDEKEAKLDDLKPAVGEWVGWIDAYLKEFGRSPKSFEQFEFEADRVLYANGQTNTALERMLRLVKDRPDAPSAAAAATLILDTYVFDKQWERLREAAEAFVEMAKLGDAAFKKRLEGLPADASFKLLEASYQAKDYAKALEQVERFEKHYPSSSLLPDCLFLASRAAEQLQQKDQSLRYLSELLTRFPKTEKRGVALLARASIEDSGFDFDAAARDYTEYLSAADKSVDRESLLKRLYFVNWLSKSPKDLDCDGRASTEDLHAECDRYRALVALATGVSPFDPSELIKKSLYSIKANHTVWSAVALTLGGKTIGYKDRLSIAQSLASRLQDQDPLIQFALVPIVNRALPETFARAAATLPRIASLKSDTKALERRVNLIKDLETSATKVVALPWASVKVAVLSSVAQAYEDFSAELAALPTPEGLSPEELAEYKKGVKEILGPFREKGKTIRAQVNELAAEFPVSPALITGGRAPASTARPEPIGLALMGKLAKAPEGQLFTAWTEALKSQAWARAGFFFQQMKESSHLSDSTLSSMRAVSLALSGAQPEAISEIESMLGALDSSAKATASRLLYSQYLASSAAKKAGKYVEQPSRMPASKEKSQ